MQFSKKFTISGLVYKLEITNDGSVSFHVIGGATDKAAYDPHHHFDDEVEFGMRDRKYFDNALPVFVKVGEILVDFIKRKKPYSLHFTSNTEKKAGIYKKLAAKLHEKIKSDYIAIEDHDTFYFVRKGHG